MPHCAQKQNLFAPVTELAGGGCVRHAEVAKRGLGEVDHVWLPPLGTQVHEELIASDAKEVGTKAGLTTEADEALDAAEKSPLNDVIDLAAKLVAKEPVDNLEVSLDQLVPGAPVPTGPAVEKIAVRCGCGGEAAHRHSVAKIAKPGNNRYSIVVLVTRPFDPLSEFVELGSSDGGSQYVTALGVLADMGH